MSFMNPRTALLAAALSLCAATAQATAVFDFSFENEDGPVAGTVSGTIGLPDGDGTFAAISLIVTSAPAALGYTLPFDVLANLTNLLENSFTVAGGQIDVSASAFTAFIAPPPGVLGSSFTLRGSVFGPGSGMNVQLSNSPLTGVIDQDNSTLTFGRAEAAVPLPAAAPLLGAALLGAAAWARRSRRRAA